MPNAEHLAELVEHAIRAALGPVVTRIAALETQAPIPGPPGPEGPRGAPGPPGPIGLEGKAGAPGLRYAGVYVEGHAYDAGDVVTHGGSAWHCHTATSAKPGETAAAWQLVVKRGKDGRDLREPPASR